MQVRVESWAVVALLALAACVWALDLRTRRPTAVPVAAPGPRARPAPPPAGPPGAAWAGGRGR